MKSMGLRKTVVLGAVLALGAGPGVASGAVQLLTVPVDGDVANSDPNARPHLAYNGRPTTLKAIARGFADAAGATFAWDTNADGSFADETEEPVRRCQTGTPEGTNCYDLGKTITIPTQATSRRFDFNVRLTIPGSPPVIVLATYPVWVRADVPATAQANTATPAQLAVMRAVAADDAMWRLHLLVGNLSGVGAAIRGELDPAGSLGVTYFADRSASFVRMMARAGHRPAYPAGSYRHDIWPFVPGRPPAPPAGFVAANDQRYNSDPYAEDAMRLLNTSLAARLTFFTSVPAADEDDDGTTPVPFTNDGVAFAFGGPGNQNLTQGDLLEAIAASGLAGTVAQVGDATYVLGRSFEHIEQQLVDFLVYGQADGGGVLCIGGWYYYPNAPCPHLSHEGSSRSIYGGLLAATTMASSGVYVNNRVRSRLVSILKYNQNATSKLAMPLGVTYCGTYQETIDVLLAARLLGWDGFLPGDPTPYVVDGGGVSLTFGDAQQIYANYRNAIAAGWVSHQLEPCFLWVSGLFFNDGGTNPTPYLRTDGKANIVALRSAAGAMRSLGVDTFDGHDWRREFGVYLVRNQRLTGSLSTDWTWLDVGWGMGENALEGPAYYGAASTIYGAEILTEPLSPAPETEITSGPSGPTTNTTPTFAFAGGEAATFECQVDAGVAAPCTSGHTTAVLSQGAHTFAVRATSPDGVRDPTPATRSFTIDSLAPPVPTLDSGPTGTLAVTSATFAFSDTEAGAQFECGLDSASFAGCTSPKGYVGLGQGSHTFQVRAKDALGNTSAAASRTWTVDTTAPPLPTIDSGPSGTVASTAANFAFSDGEGGVTFECSLDGGALVPCTSPRAYSGLGQGAHSFGTRAKDAAGNTSAIASRAWSVDTVAPQTTVKGPKVTTTSRTAKFTFSSSEPGSTFECKLDRGAWKVCKSPLTYRRLKPGSHTFQVRAKDAAGNVDTTPARFTWRIKAA